MSANAHSASYLERGGELGPNLPSAVLVDGHLVFPDHQACPTAVVHPRATRSGDGMLEHPQADSPASADQVNPADEQVFEDSSRDVDCTRYPRAPGLRNLMGREALVNGHSEERSMRLPMMVRKVGRTKKQCIKCGHNQHQAL